LTIPEEYRLRAYYYQYMNPGDYTYVPPDPEKLAKGKALVDADIEKMTQESLQFLSTTGIKILVYGVEGALCAVSITGTAASFGVAAPAASMACTALVIDISTDGAKKWVEYLYKTHAIKDEKTYNVIHGSITSTGSIAKFIVLPYSGFSSVKLAAGVLEGQSEVVWGGESQEFKTVQTMALPVKILSAGKYANEFSGSVSVIIKSPIQININAPDGKSVSIDAATGFYQSNIPGAAFTVPGMEPQMVWIPNPVAGNYQISATGTDIGKYTIEIKTTSADGIPTIETFQGIVKPGDKFNLNTSISTDSSGRVIRSKTTRTSLFTPLSIKNNQPLVVGALVVVLFGVFGVGIYAISKKSASQNKGNLASKTAYLILPNQQFRLSHDQYIGRGSGCQIRLLDPSVSRIHARITFSGTNWFIQDLGSRLGIRVNGQQVTAIILNKEDQITIGNITMVFLQNE
jgi:hypothetical protein